MFYLYQIEDRNTYCMQMYQSAQEAPLYPPQTSPGPAMYRTNSIDPQLLGANGYFPI